MKKYLLGFLLFLTFIQPLVVNMLIYNAKQQTVHTISFKSPLKKAPSSNSFGLDTVLIDLDDDDNSEKELNDHQTDIFCQYDIQEAYLKEHATLASIKTAYAPLKHSNKPLYILWSVFRI